MATDEKKREPTHQMLTSVKRTNSLSLKSLILKNPLPSRYTEEEWRVVKAALESVCLTRKTRRISEGKRAKILEALEKFTPEIVAKACQVYVTKCCATDGKNERYLLGIARGLVKQEEANRPQPVKTIDPETHWEDRGRVYDRGTMEGMAAQLDKNLNEQRSVDPQTVSRVSRCRNERPEWDWA